MAVGAKIGLKALSAVVGIPIGIATKKITEKAWLTARPQDPPRKPSEPEVRWGDALGWAALSAAGMVIADLLTQRSAKAAYRAITGSEPPRQPIKDEDKKSAKKVAGAKAK